MGERGGGRKSNGSGSTTIWPSNSDPINAQRPLWGHLAARTASRRTRPSQHCIERPMFYFLILIFALLPHSILYLFCLAFSHISNSFIFHSLVSHPHPHIPYKIINNMTLALGWAYAAVQLAASSRSSSKKFPRKIYCQTEKKTNTNVFFFFFFGCSGCKRWRGKSFGPKP